MRLYVPLVACAALAAVAGCATHQTGPNRPITIADDVAWARSLAEPDLARFYSADSVTQAALRNQVITARMYIADMEYNYYEARLTKEMQDEGLAATLASLGLTTSATLFSPAGTKTILSAIATGVTGADKAYNEKMLLSNTIQALQTQMRADRKEQAGVIFAKMLKDVGNNTKVPTPIAEYTLPMALSDADRYYQAGTIASSLIGLSKTVANADRHADEAKTISGPNPAQVSNVKTTAAPGNEPGRLMGPTVVLTPSTRNASYLRLRSLMFPDGKADVEIARYVVSLLGSPAVRAGLVLNDAKYAPLYPRISNCIVRRNLGNPCEPGSLQRFR